MNNEEKNEFVRSEDEQTKNASNIIYLIDDYYEVEIVSSSILRCAACISDNKVALYRIYAIGDFAKSFGYVNVAKYKIEEALSAFKNFFELAEVKRQM